MLQAIADKLHHIVYAAALVIIGVAAVGGYAYVETHRVVVHDANVSSPSQSTAEAITREIQATVIADRVLAASRGSAPALSQPAVAVIREIPGMGGFSPAQIAQILAGLKAPTREAIHATSKLVGPSPAPGPTPVGNLTAAELAAIQQADEAAVTNVLSDPHTHIASTVTITQEEVPPTRIGSIFTPSGSGLGFAALRRKHFEFDIGAIVRGAHLSPIVAPSYLIPHTSVAIGPFLGYDRQLIYGAAATVHF